MLLEIRILGFRLVLAPETAEALFAFIAAMLDRLTSDEKSASSENKLT